MENGKEEESRFLKTKTIANIMITKMTVSRKVETPELKRPLTALLIAPDKEIRNRILSGDKKITIREGHRDYQPGLVMICCPIEPFCVQAEITDVRHCRLNEVTEREYAADGYESQKDMRNNLRKYYPEMDYNSLVTIIKWDNIIGTAVDEYRSGRPPGKREIIEKVVNRRNRPPKRDSLR